MKTPQRSLVGKNVFKPIGCCIYCGRSDVLLRLEHIIPLAIKGEMLLPQASCDTCASITGAFEGRCCGSMFNPVRRALGYSGRRRGKKSKKTSGLPVLVIDRQGQMQKVEAEPVNHPTGLALPKFSLLPIRLRSPLEYAPQPTAVHIWRKGPAEEQIRAIAQQMDASAIAIANIDLPAFVRLLAKIGHSLAVGTFGPQAFKPFLLDLILGRSEEWMQFVGGELNETPPSTGRHYLLLGVHDILGRSIIGCQIRLFASLGAPTYFVAVGEMLTRELPVVRFDP